MTFWLQEAVDLLAILIRGKKVCKDWRFDLQIYPIYPICRIRLLWESDSVSAAHWCTESSMCTKMHPGMHLRCKVCHKNWEICVVVLFLFFLHNHVVPCCSICYQCHPYYGWWDYVNFACFSHFPVLLSNFISSDDVLTCPYYKFVYNCVTVVIHFVLLDAAHRDRRTRCRGRRRLSRTSTSLGNPASSEQCRQRRRRATTDGGRGEETDHRKKTRQCRNVETETGETGKFLKEPKSEKPGKRHFKHFKGKNNDKNETDRLFLTPFWLSFLKNLNKDINRPRLQYWMSWCFPSKFSIRDTESDLIFESMGRGTDGHGWAPMGRSLFFRTANSLSNAATPPFTEICTKFRQTYSKHETLRFAKGHHDNTRQIIYIITKIHWRILYSMAISHVK